MKVITVVGCGGNRDTTKRPVMAHIACEMVIKLFLLPDNPRNEDPQTIIEQMRASVPAHLSAKVMAITDRQWKPFVWHATSLQPEILSSLQVRT